MVCPCGLRYALVACAARAQVVLTLCARSLGFALMACASCRPKEDTGAGGRGMAAWCGGQCDHGCGWSLSGDDGVSTANHDFRDVCVLAAPCMRPRWKRMIGGGEVIRACVVSLRQPPLWPSSSGCGLVFGVLFLCVYHSLRWWVFGS